MFADDEDSKPISIILTTLAAKTYSGEQDMHLALTNILESMGKLVNSISPRVPTQLILEKILQIGGLCQSINILNLKKTFGLG